MAGQREERVSDGDMQNIYRSRRNAHKQCRRESWQVRRTKTPAQDKTDYTQAAVMTYSGNRCDRTDADSRRHRGGDKTWHDYHLFTPVKRRHYQNAAAKDDTGSSELMKIWIVE